MFLDILSRCVKHDVLWEMPGKTFDGCPIVVVGRQLLECRFGPTHRKIYGKVEVIHAFGN